MGKFLNVIKWIFTRFKYIVAWFGPFFARLLNHWFLLANISLFGISAWAFARYQFIFETVAHYFDTLTELVESVNLSTGVGWIDGFLGCLALDDLLTGLGVFLAFYLPLVGVVVFGIFVSILGFALRVLIYKILGFSSTISKGM